MKRVVVVLIALGLAANAAAAGERYTGRVVLKVPRGETVRWRSAGRTGSLKAIAVRIDGRLVARYQPVTKSGRPTEGESCRAYVYGSGIAARLGDCTGYFHIRAVNAGPKTSVLKIRYR